MVEFGGCTLCRKMVPAGSLFKVHGRGVCSECYKTLVNEANNRFISIVNWNPWGDNPQKRAGKGAAQAEAWQDSQRNSEEVTQEQAAA